ARIAMHVDAIGRAGHVYPDRDALSLERRSQPLFRLCAGRGGDGDERDNGERTRSWHRDSCQRSCFRIGATRVRLQFRANEEAIADAGYRNRGTEPAITSAMVAAALSHALATDAARARTRSAATRWMAAARSGATPPSRHDSAITAGTNKTGRASPPIATAAPRPPRVIRL